MPDSVVNIGENLCLFNVDGDPSGQGLIAAGSTAPGLTIPGSSIAKGFRRTFVERCTREAGISFSIVSTHHNWQGDKWVGRSVAKL
jgi:hypothetical protein